MIVIVVKELDSNEISQLVKTLKSQGYKVGQDFDFEYSAGTWDPMKGTIPRQTKFTCYNEKLATYIRLRWG